MEFCFHSISQALTRLKKMSGHVLFSSVACGVVPMAIAAMLISTGDRSVAQSSTTGSSPAGNAENGRKLFVRDGCFECHGREAQGGGLNGPRIAPDPIPLEALRVFVRHPTGEMPPFSAKVLSEKDLADIHAFLSSIPQPPSVDSIPILKH